MLADINNGTLITVALVIAILVGLVWLISHFRR